MSKTSWFVTVYRSSVHSRWITKQLLDLSVGRLLNYEKWFTSDNSKCSFQFFPIVEAERCRQL
jgi:hypothetical protein